jgi:hypothetical protein
MDAQERPAEREQILGMTTFTRDTQEAMLKATALEVLLELLLNISKQTRILRLKMLLERRVVFVNDLVKKGTLRTVTHIQRRANTRTGFPASRKRQHDRILAKLS